MNLIDKAIEQYQGVWPKFDWGNSDTNQNAIVLVLKESEEDTCEVGDLILGGTGCNQYYAEVVCTKKQFEKRAKQLGWVNGFLWGKVYELKGATPPTLPENCIVESTFDNEMVDKCWQEHVNWARVVTFRIVDSRFKPKQHPGVQAKPVNEVHDDLWYTRGERPPVGTVCLCQGKANVGFRASCKVRVIHYGVTTVTLEALTNIVNARSGDCFTERFADLQFHPIKSPKEKAIEKALEALSSVWNDPKDELVHVLETLFDAGLLK